MVNESKHPTAAECAHVELNDLVKNGLFKKRSLPPNHIPLLRFPAAHIPITSICQDNGRILDSSINVLPSSFNGKFHDDWIKCPERGWYAFRGLCAIHDICSYRRQYKLTAIDEKLGNGNLERLLPPVHPLYDCGKEEKEAFTAFRNFFVSMSYSKMVQTFESRWVSPSDEKVHVIFSLEERKIPVVTALMNTVMQKFPDTDRIIIVFEHSIKVDVVTYVSNHNDAVMRRLAGIQKKKNALLTRMRLARVSVKRKPSSKIPERKVGKKNKKATVRKKAAKKVMKSPCTPFSLVYDRSAIKETNKIKMPYIEVLAFAGQLSSRFWHNDMFANCRVLRTADEVRAITEPLKLQSRFQLPKIFASDPGAVVFGLRPDDIGVFEDFVNDRGDSYINVRITCPDLQRMFSNRRKTATL